jgi:hypothetical protein
VTPLGIDPETSRLVAQCLNHYATPGPPICQRFVKSFAVNNSAICTSVLCVLKFSAPISGCVCWKNFCFSKTRLWHSVLFLFLFFLKYMLPYRLGSSAQLHCYVFCSFRVRICNINLPEALRFYVTDSWSVWVVKIIQISSLQALGFMNCISYIGWIVCMLENAICIAFIFAHGLWFVFVMCVCCCNSLSCAYVIIIRLTHYASHF